METDTLGKGSDYQCQYEKLRRSGHSHSAAVSVLILRKFCLMHVFLFMLIYCFVHCFVYFGFIVTSECKVKNKMYETD